MRISELSQRSGVPIPSIKFYIREGLLPAGEHTAKNQADYAEAHLERLDLIRTLRDLGGFDLTAIARITRAMDGAPSSDAVGAAIDAAKPQREKPEPELNPQLAAARTEISALSARHGWNGRKTPGSVTEAARALSVIRRAIPGMVLPGTLDFYAQIADQIAECEIPDDWDPKGAQAEWLKFALLGTYLVEPLILALRRMAHEQRAHRLEEKREQKRKDSKSRKSKTR